MSGTNKIIWTIGHSTHTIHEFIAILKSFDIKLIADIRSYPGSKRCPQFNKESLLKSLKDAGIHYVHLSNLGGRRKPLPSSKNMAWHNEAFRGYADYMETEQFKTTITELEQFATEQNTTYMCAEILWWRCHRSLVSDYLKADGWTVIHIMGEHKSEEHHFTAPAKVKQGNLFY